MRIFTSSLLAVVLAAAAPAVWAQPKRSDADFAREKPAVGDLLPDVTIYAPDGKEVRTSTLRGHYLVLTFGCLT